MNLYLYIHGKGGSASEAAHYAALFPEARVLGLDYRAQTPWEAKTEFSDYFDSVASDYDSVFLIANSIGAYFSLCSLGEKKIKKAFLLSPIVDMERLILDMMTWASVTEAELREKKEIPTSFGETLSWEYLSWVRAHPIEWNIPTSVLYGEKDGLQSITTVERFCKRHGASLSVMKNGEHWFHTEEQMAFLDRWITSK